MKKICIVGMGNMGKAIFELLSFENDFHLIACNRSKNVNQCIRDCDYVILAVKPQSFNDLAVSINTDLSEKIIISIMAGISLETIAKKLGAKKIVRVMPNLALKYGKSVSGWISEGLNDKEKEGVKEILKKWGKEIEVNIEEMIDKITALSGSGPAYFLLLNQAIIEKALEFGFSEKDAEEIVIGTMLGTSKLMEDFSIPPLELISKIASKGGTTEAALKSFDENDFNHIVGMAIESAYKRAKELSD